MGLSTAERNRRKRERKKKEKEQQRKQEEEIETKNKKNDDVEIEYVVEEAPNNNNDGSSNNDMESVLRRFQERAAVVVVVTDDEKNKKETANDEHDDDDDDEQHHHNQDTLLSKRKYREMVRPSVAELKRRVKRADLVEAHDVTAQDPDFLIALKSIPGTVAVPRHWGRKRKYLQGKRGFEKQPFQLPDFIVKTGITDIRDTLAEDEGKMSAKQKNRARVAPKMGAMDVDYRTLHDAFFKHQTKPSGLTQFGDLYYEGRELETKVNLKPGGELSQTLREALGMTSETSPPPWLINMQRYGPPPSYPNLKIPGLNAPLPNEQCQYGYHVGGWGKPPVDAFGRPLYGGNPFDKPGSSGQDDPTSAGGLVTSDGKTLSKAAWGALPTGELEREEEESEEESEEEESSAEEESEGEEEAEAGGMESVLPPPPSIAPTAVELRKQAGDETPLETGPKQLYKVLEQQKAGQQAGAVFSSEVAYKVPGAAPVPEGAESVLSKAVGPGDASKKSKKKDEDDEAEHLDKNFKF